LKVPSNADIARIEQIVKTTLAYAAGVSESTITKSTRIRDLGIDSVAMYGAGMVLQAELGLEVTDADIIRIFTANDVAESTSLVSDFYSRSVG
jgi:acyl carrier protein